MLAAPPVNVMPVAVTVLSVPTAGVSNVAVPAHPTGSPPITPVREQLVIMAAVVPSYDLAATTTAGVTLRGVIEAVVVAVVVVRV